MPSNPNSPAADSATPLTGAPPVREGGESPSEAQLEHREGQLGKLIYATLAGGTLLLASFVAQLLFESSVDIGGTTYNPAATMLGLLAALLLGTPLVFFALRDLAKGKVQLGALVALAVLGAFVMGSYQESAAIAFFMILAGLIEDRTAVGAQASIEALVRITPTRAFKVVGESEVETEAKDLKPGDVVRVRPGDNIPADGRIVTGESTVNQANITGESIPVDKLVGDDVFGGTINLTGAMDIEVTQAGSDTTLGRVKDMILQAKESKIPILRMIDRYADWYTPTVLMFVGIVLFFNMRNGVDNAAERAITMLVIAVPAAIILATPTAMVAGLSAAARLGVLFKSVVDLEAARGLTAIVMDKTGTLTTGELSVTRLKPAVGIEGADLLKATALAEQNSRHPVARAVVEVARRANLKLATPTEFEEQAGRGVRAQVDGHTIYVGRAAWIADAAITGIPAASSQVVRDLAASPETDGLSVLFVVRDNVLLGWLGLEDNARREAPIAMDNLRSLGLKRLIIMTGDRESVAKRVAAQMHIEEYKSEVLPHEKLEMVDSLKEKGHRVAMIGDGVNDAPALAAGDISIAMGAAGSDVAIHSASIALMNNNLNRIPFLIRLSRHTSSVIKQNLAIGAVFIVVFMCLAAAGAVSPIAAAFLHVCSGLVVIFNSARLVRSGEDIEHNEAMLLREAQEEAKKKADRDRLADARAKAAAANPAPAPPATT